MEQSIELSFQTIFVGEIEIRHRGSEERLDAVRRQLSKWVVDHFTGSADIPGQTVQHLKRLTRSDIVRRQVSPKAPEKTVVNGEV